MKNVVPFAKFGIFLLVLLNNNIKIYKKNYFFCFSSSSKKFCIECEENKFRELNEFNRKCECLSGYKENEKKNVFHA